MQKSVVWYSQQITVGLGKKRVQHYVNAFHYGNADIGGDPGKDNGLTYAWLNSSLQISPLEQLAFLRAVVRRQFPLSPKAYEMTNRLMTIGALPNGWEVHGKTGTGFPLLADRSEDKNHAYGWFVGWASKGDRTVVFARLVQDEQRGKVGAGLRVRDGFMEELPTRLDSL